MHLPRANGTLLTTGGAGAMAWGRAFEEQYGVPASIDDYTEAGMPDQEVGRVTFLKTAAHVKFSRGNVTQFFCFGGCGCNSPHCGELTRRAIKRGGPRPRARSQERARGRRHAARPRGGPLGRGPS
jgi:hypothetical protein